VLRQAVLKAANQRLIELSMIRLTGRDMLDVGNLTVIAYLGGEIIKEGFSIHFRSSPQAGRAVILGF
jgi:hypothetical protein